MIPLSRNRAFAYDRAAPRWGRSMERLGYDAAYRGLVADWAAPGERVLDIGCGGGAFAAAYLDVHGAPEGLTLADPSAAMLAAARARLASRANYLKAGIGDEVGRHDLILCAHVLDHFADLAAPLTVLASALSPGGRMILVHTRPHWCNVLIWPKWRHVSRRPEEILTALGAAGLRCLAHRGFAEGPPRRTSHAYCVARATGPGSAGECDPRTVAEERGDPDGPGQAVVHADIPVRGPGRDGHGHEGEKGNDRAKMGHREIAFHRAHSTAELPW